MFTFKAIKIEYSSFPFWQNVLQPFWLQTFYLCFALYQNNKNLMCTLWILDEKNKDKKLILSFYWLVRFCTVFQMNLQQGPKLKPLHVNINTANIFFCQYEWMNICSVKSMSVIEVCLFCWKSGPDGNTSLSSGCKAVKFHRCMVKTTWGEILTNEMYVYLKVNRGSWRWFLLICWKHWELAG